MAYTNFWAAYGVVFPVKGHKAMGKETEKTS
jgi:insertion element IS1 protein InsB